MKKNFIRYSCYTALTTGLLLATLFSVACSKNTDIPKMSVSYGPEIGFANGNVDLTGSEPIVNISDIKAEVGMNIDYLSGVTIANEEDFPDLEIWVDASTVDIFTAGNYTVEYTFVYNGTTTSKQITVTLVETEQSASDAPSTSTPAENSGNSGNSENNENAGNDGNSGNNGGSSINKPTSSNNNTSEATTPNNENKTTIGNTVNPTTPTTSNTTTKPTQPSSSATTKPTNNNSSTTKPTQTTTQKPTTTRQIITTAGNKTTELKNLGNYTIELLSGDTITIKNTTSRYIVSTRTDVELLEEKGCTYRISKLIITYNTGAQHVLETVKDRIK